MSGTLYTCGPELMNVAKLAVPTALLARFFYGAYELRLLAHACNVPLTLGAAVRLLAWLDLLRQKRNRMVDQVKMAVSLAAFG